MGMLCPSSKCTVYELATKSTTFKRVLEPWIVAIFSNNISIIVVVVILLAGHLLLVVVTCTR